MKTHKTPTISVLMPVYNCRDYLELSLHSILTQSFTNFELVIINDGSTDETELILSTIKDPRVRIYTSKKMGITRSLNEGMKVCKGKYIARQDGDDVSHPKRLEIQYKILEENPHYALATCFVEKIDASGGMLGIEKTPISQQTLKNTLEIYNCITHGSVMVRKDAVLEVGGYRNVFELSQDYDLWLRMIEQFEFSVIPVVLYQYRKNPTGVSSLFKKRQEAFASLARQLANERAFFGKDTLQEHGENAFKQKNRHLYDFHHYDSS